MTEIYRSKTVQMTYENNSDRLQVSTPSGPVSTIAFHCITENSSHWDHFVAFILKHFTWSWISVKNHDLSDSDQLININSLAQRIGLTPEVIEKANNRGVLYEEIDHFLKENPPPLEALMNKSADLIDLLDLDIDNSSEAAFLASLKTSSESITSSMFELLITNFAIQHFKSVDVAEDWIKTTFGAPSHVSKNGFQPANVDFISDVYKASILRCDELNKLKT